MGQKTALVVDDSATARRILGRMLERHGLRVETANSAEEALSALGTRHPDLVFMDHMMPGMDGIEALRAIKANPETATIPVVMYTAKEGKLHVGQARALGAIGILSKQLRPGELFEVLHGLGFASEKRTTPQEPAPEKPDERDSGEILGAVTDTTARLPLEVVEQIARSTAAYINNSASQHHEKRLLDEHLQHLRHSVSQLRQELSQFGQKLESNRVNGVDGVVADGSRRQADASHPAGRFGRLVRSIAPGVLGLGLAALLVASAAIGLYFVERSERLAAHERSGKLMDSVAWALSERGAFEFGELVFNDKRAEQMRELLARLVALDFRGFVRVESSLGRHCVIGNEVDGYELPSGDWPLSSCNTIGLSDKLSGELAGLQSEAFRRFVRRVNAGQVEGIRIEVDGRAEAEPVYPYPPESEVGTAGEWNDIARLNNRIDFVLLPD